MHYTITNRCFACLVDEALVLISVADNKYLAVNPMHLRGVTFLDGEGEELRASRGVVASIRSEGENVALGKLAGKGLIRANGPFTRDDSPALRGQGKEPRQRAFLLHTMLLTPPFSQIMLLLISRQARRMIGKGDLEAVLLTAAPTATRRDRNPLPSDIRRLCANYRLLRRMLPRSNECLVDALTIAIASGMLEQRPEIVFGVKAAPFAAHCWATLAGTPLLSSGSDEQDYQPIMMAEVRSHARL